MASSRRSRRRAWLRNRVDDLLDARARLLAEMGSTRAERAAPVASEYIRVNRALKLLVGDRRYVDLQTP